MGGGLIFLQQCAGRPFDLAALMAQLAQRAKAKGHDSRKIGKGMGGLFTMVRADKAKPFRKMSGLICWGWWHLASEQGHRMASRLESRPLFAKPIQIWRIGLCSAASRVCYGRLRYGRGRQSRGAGFI